MKALLSRVGVWLLVKSGYYKCVWAVRMEGGEYVMFCLTEADAVKACANTPKGFVTMYICHALSHIEYGPDEL